MHAGLELALAAERRRVHYRAASGVEIVAFYRVDVYLSRTMAPLTVDNLGKRACLAEARRACSERAGQPIGTAVAATRYPASIGRRPRCAERGPGPLITATLALTDGIDETPRDGNVWRDCLN